MNCMMTGVFIGGAHDISSLRSACFKKLAFVIYLLRGIRSKGGRRRDQCRQHSSIHMTRRHLNFSTMHRLVLANVLSVFRISSVCFA